MSDFKKLRTAKFSANGQQKQRGVNLCATLGNMKANKRLSLSFYDQETIHNNKKIIFDEIDLISELPFVPSVDKHSHHILAKQGKTGKMTSCAKQTPLKIDTLFDKQSLEIIDMITTNATQPQQRKKDRNCSKSKKQYHRSKSAKPKTGRPKSVGLKNRQEVMKFASSRLH